MWNHWNDDNTSTPSNNFTNQRAFWIVSGTVVVAKTAVYLPAKNCHLKGVYQLAFHPFRACAHLSCCLLSWAWIQWLLCRNIKQLVTCFSYHELIETPHWVPKNSKQIPLLLQRRKRVLQKMTIVCLFFSASAYLRNVRWAKAQCLKP